MASPVEVTPPQPSPWDPEALLELAGGDSDLAQELVAVFLEDLPWQRETLRQGAAANDGDAVSAAAHQLKGALLTIAAVPGARMAAVIEGAARRGAPGGLLAPIDELLNELTRLERALEERGR